MPLILFVCTANRFRSPIAAAYMEYKLKAAGTAGSWAVASAGTWTEAGLHAMPQALIAAAAHGLDLSGHRTREVNSVLLDEASLIVVMEQGHKEALECEFPACRGHIILLGELAGERNPEIPDPARTDFDESGAATQRIISCIDKSFMEMLHRAEISPSISRSKTAITAGDYNQQP